MTELTVEKLIPGGDGLARLDGKVVFIPGTAPGDRVDVKILESKKGFSRGQVEKILDESSDRQAPFCPYFGTCGGCSWQHIRYESQLRIKKVMAAEIFQRAGLENIPEINLFSGPDQGYRCRVQFHRSSSGGWGFARRGSNDVVALDRCPLLTQGLNDFLQNPPSDTPQVDRLHLFGTDNEYWYRKSQTITQTVNGKLLHFQPELFFQSNILLLDQFLKEAAGGTEGKLFLDLYGGVGLFSSLLEDYFDRGILVESNRKTETWVKQNLSGRIRYIGKPLERWKEKPKGVDFTVVDPPRTGMAPQAIQWLCSLKSGSISYVSCDPVTQARDLAVFQQKGYRIVRISLFDFYPHTPHMETVVRLTL